VPDATGIWVCRPDGGLQEGDPCADFQDCGEGLACVGGYCYETCSFYSTSRCDANDTCFGFDPQQNFGLCVESCTSIVPDDCTDPGTRCIELGPDQFACAQHGGAALGDSCTDALGCGQELICDENTDTCVQLCEPFDATTDRCAAGQSCFPATPELGLCFPSTTAGTAQGDACSPQGVLCDDAIICGPGVGTSICYQVCRLGLSDSAGINNPDCASSTDVCNPDNGWEGMGFCMSQ
jgi:hypothetical protein